MGSRLENRSKDVAKRIESHTFSNEEGEEYEESKFGGFGDYFRRKKIKLQNLDAELRSQQRPDAPQIFKGIVCFVNGYTQPSLNDLHKLVVSHGGGFLQYLDGKTMVTHIIAANLTPKKAIEFRKYRIVKPAWVVDSVEAGRVLPWENYRVVDEGSGQKLLGFQGGQLASQRNDTQKTYREQTNVSWYSTQMKDIAKDIEDDIYDASLEDMGYGEKAASTPKVKNEDLDGMDEDIEDDANGQRLYSDFDNHGIHKSSHDTIMAGPDSPIISVEGDPFSQPPAPKSPSPAPLPEPMQPPSAEPSAPTSPPRGQKRSFPAEFRSPSKRDRPITAAEQHNMQLLKDPKIRQSSAANPDFLTQFYSESRLHYLSESKAKLKAKFQAMVDARTPSQAKPFKRKPGARRYIMHVDFDCFFCAVSLLSAPEYKDKPAAVAHGEGSGAEIASCNYPARAKGVKNGMWMKTATELCPEIKVLPYDFPAYEAASEKFYGAILDIGGIVESVSVDEALVDITGLVLPAGGSDGLGIGEGNIYREQAKADELGQAVRKRIKELTGCNVSVGIGGNVLLAKVALRRAKPAGQYQIKPEEVLDFIGELTVQDLPGIGYSIGGKLEEIGVKFVKDVRNLNKGRLMQVLGPKTGEKVWDYSRGIDKTEVGEQVVRKSVSAEVNWGIRFISQPEAEEFVTNLCGELTKRLLAVNVKGKQLTLKVMRKAADAPLDPPKHLGHGKCDTFNKSTVLGVATNAADILAREAISSLRSFNFPPGELRGLGVQMTKLEPIKQFGPVEGSQRMLSFAKAAPKPAPSRQQPQDDIEDPQTPRKSKNTPAQGSSRSSHTRMEDIDPDSPEKPRETPVHPAAWIARQNEKDPSAKKPLNMLGTQFIMPSQVDEKVLAELPVDIRSRLMAQGKSRTPSRTPSTAASRAPSPFVAKEARSSSPTKQGQSPPPGMDRDVFDALPKDIKAEVLAEYARENPTTVSRQASIAPAPQSPRKPAKLGFTKAAPASKKPVPLMQRGKKSASTLTQSSFITKDAGPSHAQALPEPAFEDTELDPEFLAAIPEAMRREVIAEHKRARMAARAKLSASMKKKLPVPAPLPRGQQKLKLPPKRAKPTFTTDDLSRVEDLRQMVEDWHREFRDTGPHPSDVEAIGRFLGKVVLDEKNMAKAVEVVKWLQWSVNDARGGAFQSEAAEKRWDEVVQELREAVDRAVVERGVGAVDWDV